MRKLTKPKLAWFDDRRVWRECCLQIQLAQLALTKGATGAEVYAVTGDDGVVSEALIEAGYLEKSNE